MPSTDDAARAESPAFARLEAIWRPEVQRWRTPSLGRAEAELLGCLAAARGARRALELGTAIGLSAAYLAEGMGPEGRVVAVDLDSRRAAKARELWAAAGLADRVSLQEGDALALLPELGGGFDLVFVDLLWELGSSELGRQLGRGVATALVSGGLLVADNCSQRLPAAEGFLAEISGGTFRLWTVLPLRDGLLVATRS